jgi:hypothetical protein
MKTLDDFKNEVAVELGWKDWYELNLCKNFEDVPDTHLEKAAIAYAKYIQEETIKSFADKFDGCILNKHSILHLERILK